jgi:hypothetical protein
MDPTVQEHLAIAQEFLAFATWLRQSGRDDAVTVGRAHRDGRPAGELRSCPWACQQPAGSHTSR